MAVYQAHRVIVLREQARSHGITRTRRTGFSLEDVGTVALSAWSETQPSRLKPVLRVSVSLSIAPHLWKRIHSRGIDSNSEYCKPSTQKQVGFQAAELLIWLLILGAPSNHAGRKPILIRRANRHGCRFSRAGPGMALRGGPPNQCRITGMPSLGEGPSGGARAFCLLLRSIKSEAP